MGAAVVARDVDKVEVSEGRAQGCFTSESVRLLSHFLAAVDLILVITQLRMPHPDVVVVRLVSASDPNFDVVDGESSAAYVEMSSGL